jgi:hypothetical protein
VPPGHGPLGGQIGRPARHSEAGCSARAPDDLDVGEVERPEAHRQGLHDGFLGREPGGQAGNGITPA